MDAEYASNLLCDTAEAPARAQLPQAVSSALTLGQLTALQKPNGRVRGIVAGDTLRRMVARTLAQQYGPELEAACAPFQYALSTRAATGCVADALRVKTDTDPQATIISINV